MMSNSLAARRLYALVILKSCDLGCNKIEDMEHLNDCKEISQDDKQINFDEIINGNHREQKENIQNFMKKLKLRNEIEQEKKIKRPY